MPVCANEAFVQSLGWLEPRADLIGSLLWSSLAKYRSSPSNWAGVYCPLVRHGYRGNLAGWQQS